MAQPKRKISKQRQRKRRTHHKVKTPALGICSITGVTHLLHRAYEVAENLY